VAEMEKLMLTNTKIGDKELHGLALARSTQLKESILKSGQVTADRVFVVEPKQLNAPKNDKAKSSRADFKLK
jgi:hypothetical protein